MESAGCRVLLVDGDLGDTEADDFFRKKSPEPVTARVGYDKAHFGFAGDAGKAKETRLRAGNQENRHALERIRHIGFNAIDPGGRQERLRRRDTALRERRQFRDALGGARFGQKGFDGRVSTEKA